MCETSGTDCSDCYINFVLIGNVCTSNCANDEYLNIGSNKCETCNDPCFTCINSPDTCTSCKFSLYLDTVSKVCVTTCPDGYYKDTSTFTCKQCNA